VESLLDAGSDLKANVVPGKTPWGNVKFNASLIGTEVCWRLNEARFK